MFLSRVAFSSEFKGTTDGMPPVWRSRPPNYFHTYLDGLDPEKTVGLTDGADGQNPRESIGTS